MNFRFAVADDAIFIREIIKNIGEGLGGVCVGEAENGRDTVSLIKKTLPDLLFLDLVMPIRNGLEIIDEMKEIWPDLKIIVCTTMDQKEMMTQVENKGIHDYLTKPFSKSDIEAVIDKMGLTRKEHNRV